MRQTAWSTVSYLSAKIWIHTTAPAALLRENAEAIFQMEGPIFVFSSMFGALNGLEST